MACSALLMPVPVTLPGAEHTTEETVPITILSGGKHGKTGDTRSSADKPGGDGKGNEGNKKDASNTGSGGRNRSGKDGGQQGSASGGGGGKGDKDGSKKKRIDTMTTEEDDEDDEDDLDDDDIDIDSGEDEDDDEEDDDIDIDSVDEDIDVDIESEDIEVDSEDIMDESGDEVEAEEQQIAQQMVTDAAERAIAEQRKKIAKMLPEKDREIPKAPTHKEPGTWTPLSTSTRPDVAKVTAADVAATRLTKHKKRSTAGGLEFAPTLKAVAAQYPFVRTEHGPQTENMYHPYIQADDITEMLLWPMDIRGAVEWQRARNIQAYLQQHHPELNDSIPTVEELVFQCREQGLTPVVVFNGALGRNGVRVVAEHQICKVCGAEIRHDGKDMPQDAFAEHVCNKNRRAQGPMTLSSSTPVDHILAVLNIDPNALVKERSKELKDMQQKQHAYQRLLKTREAQRKGNGAVAGLPPPSHDENIRTWLTRAADEVDASFGLSALSSLHTSSHDLHEAGEAYVLESMLVVMCRRFIEQLARESLDVARTSADQSAGDHAVAVTPYHVYQAVLKTPEFDFATDAYLGKPM
eukprot:Clim_evm2s153 gene=Clim_evmTU2s153